MGSVMVDKRIGDIGDLDTVMAVLRMGPGGDRPHATSTARGDSSSTRPSSAGSWSGLVPRFTDGHDQRIELFGENGMLVSENPTATYLVRHTSRATSARDRLHHSLERNAESYVREIDGFVDAVEAGVMPSPGFEDGRRALLAANAAAAPSVSLPETPRSKPFGSSENLQPESGLAATGGCARIGRIPVRQASVTLLPVREEGLAASLRAPGAVNVAPPRSRGSSVQRQAGTAGRERGGRTVRSTPASSRASRQQTRSDCSQGIGISLPLISKRLLVQSCAEAFDLLGWSSALLSPNVERRLEVCAAFLAGAFEESVHPLRKCRQVPRRRYTWAPCAWFLPGFSPCRLCCWARRPIGGSG